MLTLIKREIRDNAVIFLVVVLLTILTITIVVPGFFAQRNYYAPIGIPIAMYGVFAILLFVLPFFAIALGATQTYLDRKKKICSFISTLAATRKRFLFAKILSGLLWLVFPFVSLAMIYLILMNHSPSMIPVDYSLLINIFVVTFLVSLSSYLAGLLLGMLQSKILAYSFGILIYILFLSLIIIKGFGPEMMLLYAFISVALLINTYQRFLVISL
jgi:hypothetical protein